MLVIFIIGLALPHSININKTLLIHKTNSNAYSLISDLKYWPELMSLQSYHGLQAIKISQPSNQIGAHLNLTHKLFRMEITITKMSAEQFQFSALFDNEHNLQGTFNIKKNKNSQQIDLTLAGNANYAIMGGYIALFFEYFCDQVTTSMFNNLYSNTLLKEDNGD